MIAALLLLLQSATTSGSADALARLQAQVPVEIVAQPSPSRLAGHYTSTSAEVRKKIGGFLSGEDLYLFSDGTYIYTEWTDIFPLTIEDSGTWRIARGCVSLRSSPAITWQTTHERTFLAVRRPAREGEAILVGLGDSLKHIEQFGWHDPEFSLLAAGLVREEAFDPAAGRQIKKKLMADAWRPERHGK